MRNLCSYCKVCDKAGYYDIRDCMVNCETPEEILAAYERKRNIDLGIIKDENSEGIQNT